MISSLQAKNNLCLNAQVLNSTLLNANLEDALMEEESAMEDIESLISDIMENNYVTLISDLEIRCVASSMPNLTILNRN